MADTKEILMRIGNGSGADLEAECQAALRSAPADPLMRDFVPGRFFEIKDFSLSIGLHDKDAPAPAAKDADQGKHPRTEPSRPAPQGADAVRKVRQFASWRDGVAGARYPLEVQPVSFSRVMDRASTTLLQNLCQSKSYASATIVRRVGTGQDDLPRAYLRLEFSCVLVTSIDWDDQDLVHEKYKFICQGVSVQYKPQQADAFLSAVVQGKWPKTS